MNAERIAVVVVFLALVVSLVKPIYPKEQFLQHLPTVPVLGALYVVAGRSVLSPASLRALLAFLLVHIVGARYIYSFVPYDRAAEALSGHTVSELLGLTRNHYDRFAHLAFGALLVLPIAELARRRGGMERGWSIVFSVSSILALSAVYESFEWALTMVLSPAQAESYNGQQGDGWDAQKDMALAALGAALAIVPSSRARVLAAQANKRPQRTEGSADASALGR